MKKSVIQKTIPLRIIAGIILSLTTTLSFQSNSFAEQQKFPNISGEILAQIHTDRIVSTQKTGVSPNNSFLYIEPNMSLNFDENWSIKTDWRFQPNNTLTTRNTTNSERYRTILQNDRGFNPENNGLIVEELKIDFRNEDMIFFAGKFDPTFGTAFNKSKKLGIFTSQFAEDYNLREKIGTGISALLENSKLTLNTFFNDTTGLSRSAMNDRKRAGRNDTTAGNTGTLSSYSVSLEGENFLGVHNMFYNLGYRSLGINSDSNRTKRENGYTFSSEYSYRLGEKTTIVPFVELVRITDFTGELDRDANYATFALIGKYSGWNAGVSYLDRHIKQKQRSSNISDQQLQISAGYRFTNNFAIDISRSSIKEDGHRGSVVGAVCSYLHKF